MIIISSKRNLFKSMTEIKSKDLTNIRLALEYNYKYKYFKQKLLENQYDKLEEMLPGLNMVQYNNLRLMIEVDMIINFIQYCNELATMAICIKNKQIFNFNEFLAGISDDSIGEFFNKIENSDLAHIRKYMGYHDMIIYREEYKMYDDSCIKYQKDVGRLAKFYNKYLDIYLSYKHGFRIIPINDKIKGNMIIEARKESDGGLYATYPIPEIRLQTEIIEMIEIINNIFERLYIPQIRKKFSDFAGISKGEKDEIVIEATDINISKITEYFSYPSPWLKLGKEKPFY